MHQTITFSFVVKNTKIDEDMLTEITNNILTDVLDGLYGMGHIDHGVSITHQEVRDSTEKEIQDFEESFS